VRDDDELKVLRSRETQYGIELDAMMNKAQVADLLGVCIRSVELYVQNGWLDCYKLGDHQRSRVVFSPKQVDEFLFNKLKRKKLKQDRAKGLPPNPTYCPARSESR
tara:strand:+ start:5950 stop:6267 length:318 start_codon:yes stop_codon:yes gene_type:complete